MKILVTGPSGFIAQPLMAYLSEQGHEVVGVSLREDNWMSLIPKDIDVYIHLAALVHTYKGLDEFRRINTELTATLFDHFKASKAKDFVFMSTVKAVVDESSAIINEATPCHPTTPYGISKLEAEAYIQQECPDDKRYFILRPSLVYGAHVKGNLALLEKLVHHNIPYPLGNFENKRTLLSVDNINYCTHQLIINADLKSDIFMIADDESLSTTEIINIISQAKQKKSRIWKINKSLIKGFVRLGDIFNLPLNHKTFNKLTEDYRIDNAKLKRVLQIEKMPISSQKGLKHAFEI